MSATCEDGARPAAIDLHRLGELVMDRMLKVERRRPDLADPSTATALPDRLDVSVGLLRNGTWVEWHATLEVHEENGTWWAAGDGVNAVGTDIDELADMIAGAVEMAACDDGNVTTSTATPPVSDVSPESPQYSMVPHGDEPQATIRWMIVCDEGWRTSIVCEGMYEWAAKWLLGVLGRNPYAPETRP